ncbi:C-type lectin domain family 4 member E-like [Pseudoliparis swirei]|uniref:C-type lectin domain family 4 member E-like n=1 Tax=Pseudoliparis swirei TaxID=2059687 RepID=UPI0024BE1404|nr:C-type lectin domain family 4 member E-like [Pseudoliparis swirei]
MTEDIYAKPDFTKKIRFQTDVKEDRNPDVHHDIDDVRIYDNYCAEEITPPEKSQDNTTKEQQQTASVDVSSEKRSVFRAGAVLLGLLCLLLLAAVIILVVLFILERNGQWVENANLNGERDKLRTSYSEMKGLYHNLTLKANQLENEKDHLEAANNNLIKERDELQKLVDETTSCCTWKRFGNSCYFTSTSMANWSVSNTACQLYDAQLVIISSDEEQMFITSFEQNRWIGLTDRETEGVWKWVDGTDLNKTYWKPKQPDNHNNNEDCVHMSASSDMNNWNDMTCDTELYFTCEKVHE